MVTVENGIYPEISLDAGQVQGWKDIPLREDDSLDPLIPSGPLAQEAGMLMTSSLYFGEHSNSPYAEKRNTLEGSLLTLFARQSVVRRLLAAEQLLPPGHHLLVFDAYRTYQVQKSLYDLYKQKLREKYPGMDNETLEAETRKYVSLPSMEPTRPSPHTTGGSVDVAIVKLDRAHEEELLQIRSQLTDAHLTIAKRVGMEMRLSAIMRRHASMLDFGTAFDHGGEKSALAYYESKVSDTSHELNTPLTTMIGQLTAMQEGKYALTEERVAILKEQAERLAELVQQLDAYTKARMPVTSEPEDIPLRQFCEELTNHFCLELKQKGITAKLHIAEDYLIHANGGALQQILTNLMQNTLRYSQSTEVTIEATAHKLLFSDNGKGVPSESLPYLFERFYRVDTSRSRATGGLGLGLAIVRELAESQGWAITAVAGDPGLTFVLEINIVRQQRRSQVGGEQFRRMDQG